ncbi:MAG: hypothetical protein IJ877_04875 [Candidatus Gastranaerophilales bacterium]|nr:hypothetical protein [Candidatus Gastranaerophilales bacterium]
MKKLLLLFLLFSFNIAFSEVISGKINHDDINYSNKIVDYKTGMPLENARISIPDLNYSTYSNSDGTFKLNADVTNKTVLFVEKEGYKTFSLTIDNTVLNSPLKLGIEQTSPFDLQISQGIIRLGDNMFSTNSANSYDFHQSAHGHIYTQTFDKPKSSANQDIVVVIGSLIGVDTKRAKEKGQNRIARVYASPAEVFINGHKIGILDLNGDNIEIVVPKNLIKAKNELKIQAGKNLFQKEYTDYDDIELANIRIEAKQTHSFARY